MRIEDIAQLAGVSISTVSKIVNGKDDGISAKTRERVLAIVKKYNYTPYSSVRNNWSQKSLIIGFISTGSVQMRSVLAGVMEGAQKQNYSVIACNSNGDYEEETKCITKLCRNKVDAIIWEKANQKSHKLEKMLTKQKIPISIIGPLSQKQDNQSRIDYLKWGYCATKNLVDHGHRNIGCSFRKEKMGADLFFQGFLHCLFENQIVFDENKHKINAEKLNEEIFLRKLTGFVCFDVESADEICTLAERFSFKIPRDFSVIAISDDGQKHLTSKASLIHLPMEDFGEYICTELINQIEKKDSTLNSFSWNLEIDSSKGLDVPYTSRHKNILVIGSIHMDEMMNVPEMPQVGKTIKTDVVTSIPGGKGLNQAVGAAKLGANVSLIARVGWDYEGANIHDILTKNNIDSEGLVVDQFLNTGKAFIYIKPSGESSIVICDGANNNLSINDLIKNKALFKNASYCLLPMEVPIETAEYAANMAKTYQLKTILKPTALPQISSDLLENTDIFVPNEKEANILCPNFKTIEEKAQYFIEKGAGTIIITLGEKGCYLKNASNECYFPAVSFAALDTTGGADAFISTLAVYLNENYEISDAIRMANCAAAFCVTRQGVIPALVDRITLELYMADYINV